MNLNDQRLGAYNRILKSGNAGKGEADQKPDSSGTAGGNGAGKAPSKPSALPGLIKVPSSGNGGKESPYRKVAKFLLLVGVDEAAKIIARLSPEQTDKVVLELASIRSVDRDEAALVLAEFESLLLKAREPSGGVDTARTILETAFGPERAAEMLKKAVPNLGGRPFDYLDDIDPDRLHRIIADELPAVKALVLSQIKPAIAANVIRMMTPEEKKETVLRLAKLKHIDPEVLRRVDDTIREKVLSVETRDTDAIDGRSSLAEILKRMDGSSEKSILESLSDSDPDLGRDLRNRLFTVDDVVRSDDKFLQETLRPMSEHDLAVLVAGKTESFRQKIFGNISRTRGALVLEEEQIIAPVARAESDRTTGVFMMTMRRGWEKGAFFIEGRDSSEGWVK
jgi:Flagellar motor switch protein